MRNLIFVLVFLSGIFCSGAKATLSFTFDDEKENLLVSGASLGEELTITQANLSPVIEAKADSSAGGFEIRVFFNDTATAQIESSSSEAGDSSTSILEVLLPEANSSLTSKIQYARLQTPNTREGGLSRLAADSQSTTDGVVSTNFKNKLLKPSTGKETLVVFTISNINLLTGNYPFVINLRSDSATSVGSLDSGNDNDNNDNDDSDDEETTSFDAELTSIGDSEFNAYKALSDLNIVCNEENPEEGALDICISQDAVTTLKKAFDNASTDTSLSVSAIKELRTKIKAEVKSGNLKRKAARKILQRLKCALKLDKKANSAIDEFQRIHGSSIGPFKNGKSIRLYAVRAYTKLKQAYERCKVKLAQELSQAGLISETTLNRFKIDIDDYEVSSD